MHGQVDVLERPERVSESHTVEPARVLEAARAFGAVMGALTVEHFNVPARSLNYTGASSDLFLTTVDRLLFESAWRSRTEAPVMVGGCLSFRELRLIG